MERTEAVVQGGKGDYDLWDKIPARWGPTQRGIWKSIECLPWSLAKDLSVQVREETEYREGSNHSLKRSKKKVPDLRRAGENPVFPPATVERSNTHGLG